MSRIVQEKFQVDYPQKEEPGGASWKSDTSVRRKGGLTTRASDSGQYRSGREGYNDLPPGTDISDQECARIPEPTMSTENMGNGGQVTNDVTPQSVRDGFSRKQMRPTDDMYTREHNDAFYDTITVEGVEGFVERNNLLDRL